MTEAAIEAVGGQAQTSDQNPPAPDFRSVKHKVKIEDQEAEIDYDELVKGYQNQKASTKRYQESASMMKQAKAVEALIDQARSGDLSWLDGIVPGEQLTQWAESKLLKHIEYEQLSEPEKRALRAEEALAKREEEDKKRKESDEKNQLTQLEMKASQEIDLEIAEAIKSMGHDVKVTPRLIKRVAEQIEASIEASDDAPIMPAKVASERAYKGLKLDFQEFVSLASPEEVLALLPPKLRAAIRKQDVDDVTKQLPFGARKSQKADDPIEFEGDEEAPQKKFKRMSTEDYFSRMDKKLGIR